MKGDRSMEDTKGIVNFEEVLDAEINDIWDIFFPYMAEKREKIKKPHNRETRMQKKPRRYLRFLTM